MRITVEIHMPDDFLVAELPTIERNRILVREFQDALNREYPYVRIVKLDSERTES